MTTNQPPNWHVASETCQPEKYKSYYNISENKLVGPNAIGINGVVSVANGVQWLYDYELIPKLPTVEETAMELAELICMNRDIVASAIHDYGKGSQGDTKRLIDAYIQAKERSGK